MGQFIVKVSPEEDAYFVWSTVVDAPVSYVMTRAEMETWLLEDALEQVRTQFAIESPPRFRRADESGTSALSYGGGAPSWAWGDAEHWREGRPEDIPDIPMDRTEVAGLLREMAKD